MPPFQILPVENTKWDRDQVANCLITAMYPDAYYRAIYPSTPLPDLIHYASLRLGMNLQNPKAWFLKVVAADEPRASSLPNNSNNNNNAPPDATPEANQEIIAYVRYILPPSLLAKLEGQYPKRVLSAEEVARYRREQEAGSDGVGMPKGISEPLLEVVEPVMAKAREAFPAHEGIVLDMLATHPSHQNRGAASALVQWGINLADREGVYVCLEATQGKGEFYRKFGFEKVSEAKHDLRPWGGEGIYTHDFMVREPKLVVG